MILTCPACSTNYVVKDGAIPPQGRQVRCAACKHSWHQDGDQQGREVEPGQPAEPPITAEEHSIDATVDHAPWDHSHDAAMTSAADGVSASNPERSAWDDPTASPLAQTFEATAPIAHDGGASTPIIRAEADVPPHSFASPHQPVDQPEPEPDPVAPQPDATSIAVEPEPEVAQPAEADDDFARYSPIYDDEDPPRRRWPWVIVLLMLIVAAAAAFWFLAPPSWKVRAGIAGAAGSALEVKVDSTDRTPLAQSDKDLVTVSGRIINNSDQDQSLPPIHVLLSDKASKQVVHRWTIAPPVATLAPRQATNFNSAEIGVPRTGEDLTVRLGP